MRAVGALICDPREGARVSVAPLLTPRKSCGGRACGLPGRWSGVVVQEGNDGVGVVGGGRWFAEHTAVPHRWYLWHLWYLWYLWYMWSSVVPVLPVVTTGTTGTTGSTGTTGDHRYHRYRRYHR